MKKYNYFNLLFILPFLLGLYVAVNDGIIYPFEKSLFDGLRVLAPYADIPMRAITELGSAVGVICVTLLIVIISAIKKHFFDFGVPVALTAIISRVINISLKNILDRPRPEFKVLEASETSFPSGHAQNNMALYLAVLFAALLILKAPKLRRVLMVGCVTLPIIIGITRVYFGVHYISDVVAGWSIGIIVAYNVYYLYFRFIYPCINKKDKNNNETS